MEDLDKRINELKKEKSKWFSAVFYVGREQYIIGSSKEFCSINRGGAINALGEKQKYFVRYTPYDTFYGGANWEYHLDPRGKDNIDRSEKEIITPNPNKAVEFIDKSLEYIISTTNPLKITGFQQTKSQLIQSLLETKYQIKIPYKPKTDYHPIQRNLWEISKQISNIEQQYELELSELRNKRNKIIAKKVVKAGIAAASVAAGAILLSKVKKVKYVILALKKLI